MVLTLVPTVVLVMGTLVVACDVLRLRVGKVRLGLVERDLVVGGVDVGQRIAGLHRLVVVDVDLDDVAGDARAHLVEVAVHLRVVGVLGKGRAPVEEDRRRSPAAGSRRSR